MIKKTGAEVGSIYAIPGGGKYAFAKVIYLSNYFKNLMLIRFFEKSFSAAEMPVEPLDSLPNHGIYTGTDSIKKGAWIYICTMNVTDTERVMSRRLVGGDVWVGDEHLGSDSAEETSSLPNMDVFGYRLIEKVVSRLT